jgi:hypothetical protein
MCLFNYSKLGFVLCVVDTVVIAGMSGVWLAAIDSAVSLTRELRLRARCPHHGVTHHNRLAFSS